MYYEENYINGVLHHRTTPDGEWTMKRIPALSHPVAQPRLTTMDAPAHYTSVQSRAWSAAESAVKSAAESAVQYKLMRDDLLAICRELTPA